MSPSLMILFGGERAGERLKYIYLVQSPLIVCGAPISDSDHFITYYTEVSRSMLNASVPLALYFNRQRADSLTIFLVSSLFFTLDALSEYCCNILPKTLTDSICSMLLPTSCKMELRSLFTLSSYKASNYAIGRRRFTAFNPLPSILYLTAKKYSKVIASQSALVNVCWIRRVNSSERWCTRKIFSCNYVMLPPASNSSQNPICKKPLPCSMQHSISEQTALKVASGVSEN